MRFIDSSIEPFEPVDAEKVLKKIEYACRTCYQSHDKIADGTAEKLIRNCLKRGHESVLEHAALTFKVVCSRATLAQWTRHRIASYSVESQRYCSYAKDKFGSEITYIKPAWFDKINSSNEEESSKYNNIWNLLESSCKSAEEYYFNLINAGAKPEEARAILPNATKCEMVWTANVREIRHFIKLRASAAADPDIRIIARQLLQWMRDNGLGVLVEDIEVN